MLKVIIADNEAEMRIELINILQEIMGVGEIKEAGDGKQLLRMVEEQRHDIIILNPELPLISGLEAARRIYSIDSKISLIFISKENRFAYAAFEFYALDYLLKPVDELRIRQTIKRVKELKQETNNLKLCFQGIDGLKFINPQDIILITRTDRKTTIYTTQRTVWTYDPLQRIKARLQSDQFFRCHKGYIINVQMVSEIIAWGAKTHLVKFINTSETALITLDKLKEFKIKYTY